ncbi:MAG TPA: WG repeat-containing protein, partial [Bacilli bacterium]|nr:WG repeat-containing protein [Bacilli bacterium]
PFDEIIENQKTKDIKEIDTEKKPIVEFKPKLRDLYVKKQSTKVVLTKIFSVIIIIMLLGFQFFISKTGDILDKIIIYAINEEPIKIIENKRVGYIDIYGERVINPKYLYGEEFVKNYAIVKNSNNLPLIIDRLGNEKAAVGVYFSLYRSNNYIIASKITKNGLKYGILDNSLNVIVDFKYDYIFGYKYCFSFVRSNTVGVLNLSGKEIYQVKLSDIDDKKIYIDVAKSNNNSQRYGVVTVNGSSNIINLNTGLVIYKNTVNEIESKENNIFIETVSKNNKKNIYIYNDKVVINSDIYVSIVVTDINTGIIKVVYQNLKVEYLNVKNLRPISNNLKSEDIKYGENVFIYKSFDYRKGKTIYYGISNSERIFSVYAKSVLDGFKNNFAKVEITDNKYNYINKSGKLVNNKLYDEVSDFTITGYAIVKSNNKYGIINKYGDVVIKCVYDDILDFNDAPLRYAYVHTKKSILAVKKDNSYTIVDLSNNKVIDGKYSRVEFDKKYDIIKLENSAGTYLYTFSKEEFIDLDSFDTDYTSHKSYIEIGNKLYNYSGKLIYTKGGNNE